MSLSNSEPLKFTYSERQKKQLVVENHLFNKCQQRHNGDIYWCCTERSSVKNGKLIHHCKSSCTTKGDRLVSNPSEHNHEPKHTAESIELNQNLKMKIKKRARTDKKTPIPQLFQEELAKFAKTHPEIEQNEKNATSIKSLKSYATSLYNERNNKGLNLKY